MYASLHTYTHMIFRLGSLSVSVRLCICSSVSLCGPSSVIPSVFVSVGLCLSLFLSVCLSARLSFCDYNVRAYALLWAETSNKCLSLHTSTPHTPTGTHPPSPPLISYICVRIVYSDNNSAPYLLSFFLFIVFVDNVRDPESSLPSSHECWYSCSVGSDSAIEIGELIAARSPGSTSSITDSLRCGEVL